MSTGMHHRGQWDIKCKVCQNSRESPAHKPKRSRPKTASWQEQAISACRNRNMNSSRPKQSLWIFCLRDGCFPENFIAGTFLFALLFYTWSNRVKRWTAGFLLFENLDGCPFRWVLQGMVREKLQELLSAVSQMSALFLLFSADSIILFFSFFSSPLEYFVPAKKMCLCYCCL